MADGTAQMFSAQTDGRFSIHDHQTLVEWSGGSRRFERSRSLAGTYIVAEGGPKPYRVKFRSPSFSNLSALSEMAVGHKIADLVTILATLDFVVPDIDR